MKAKQLIKILKTLRNNPSVMVSSDVYAAGRDYGYDDIGAKCLVEHVFSNTKYQMLLSSVFRAGYSRALISVEQKAEHQAEMEMLSERKRRAKEFIDLLPDGRWSEKLSAEIYGALEVLEYGEF